MNSTGLTPCKRDSGKRDFFPFFPFPFFILFYYYFYLFDSTGQNVLPRGKGHKRTSRSVTRCPTSYDTKDSHSTAITLNFSCVLHSPDFSRQQNAFFLPLLLSLLSSLQGRMGTCRIHAYFINSVFNLTDESSFRCEDLRNERDSAREETSRKEIHEMKTISEDYQRKHQALQKNLVSVTEEFWSMDVENERLHKESSARRSKCDDPGIQVRGLSEMPGRKRSICVVVTSL